MNTRGGAVLEILARTLYSLEEQLALLDPSGRIVYENPAMSRALGTGLAAAELRLRIEGLARSLVCGHNRGGLDGRANGGVAQEVVRLWGKHFQIRGHYLGTTPPGDDSFVLVCLDRLPTDAAALERLLRERFRLTYQEINVARLLARRRSNDEIARELEISGHTARHHTQHVLTKLGVHRRHEVARMLEVLFAAPPDAGAR